MSGVELLTEGNGKRLLTIV